MSLALVLQDLLQHSHLGSTVSKSSFVAFVVSECLDGLKYGEVKHSWNLALFEAVALKKLNKRA